MGGGSSCNPKSLNFPLLLDITFHQKVSPFFPPLITDHILEKKVFLKAFRQILPNILPGMRIFCYTISLLTKNIPSFDVALLPPPGLDCPPFPEPMWETLGICIQFAFSHTKSVIPSPSNGIFHVITLYKLHLLL